MKFDALIKNINSVQHVLQAQAAHAVNLSLTARNWLVGFYIVEFEQHGEDRAEYGDNLLKRLAQRLNRRGLSERRLYEFRQTYSVYPQLGETIVEYIANNNHQNILRTLTAKLQVAENQENKKLRTVTAKSQEESWKTPADRLFYRLSASHLLYLSNIKEPLKRAFYEQEAIHGCWTVRELDRQVSRLFNKELF